ncbi:MAG: hypothetical protein K0S08_82 [Gammaproteobacteria bacterium]|jgi:hypothetical protein|nr:hypothetical protein [Gammaproteobacteria bacterium]
MKSILTICPLQQDDIPHIIHYWFSKTEKELRIAGVEKNKMWARKDWGKFLPDTLSTPLEQATGWYPI